ncbi:MAG TPA: HEAT repeat domain-containing protein [Actinomycetota bacterium]|nr:HEAT repeat domain-containing protein [Actinomycetota bacterium]
MERLLRIVGLRPGEGRSVGLATAIAFSVAAGLMIGQSGIEALFFARHGVGQLPVMYLILGASMFFITIGFGALLARTDRAVASVAVPIVVAALALLGRIGLAADVGWVTHALWLLQGAGYFVLGLTVWGVAGIVADTRQAKRFFPLIGAGTVLGTVLGGLVTKPLASSLGTPNLLLVWIGTLGVATVLAGILVGPTRARSVDRPAGEHAGLLDGFREARRSALLRWLSAASVLFSLLFFSLYLPFSRAAVERYPDADELAGFLGAFFGVSAGLAFLVSLFATNRLLSRFGVPVVALVFPLLYVVAFGALTVHASFVVLAAARFTQVTWMQGGASSAWEAVVNTVPPDRRDRTRAYLYGGPTQVGTVLAGLVALVGEDAFSPRVLYVIGLVAAVLLTIAMLGVRREYPRELVRALREGRPSVFGSPTERTPVVAPDASAVRVALAGLDDDDVRVRRVAAVALGDLGDPAALPALTEASRDRDAEVRANAIDAVAGLGGNDPAQGVLTEALRDRDPRVRVAAAEALARSGDQAAIGVLEELAAAPAVEERVLALRAMGRVAGSRSADVVAARLVDEAPAVRAQALRAAASIDPAGALDAALAATADPSRLVRDAAADALTTIGEAAVPALVGSLDVPERRDGALAALDRLPTDAHGDAIRRIAGATVEVALERDRLASSIAADGDPAAELLRASLRFRAERDAVAALRAAGLLGRRAEMQVALDSLVASDGLQRANALEVIESVADRQLVRPLLSMWDRDTATRRSAADAVAEAARDPDPWIRACAGLAAGAGDATTGGGAMETLTTLSPMERVLFLRKVPLFAELPPPDLLPIASIAKEVVFAEGERIATQGDPGDVMHVIVDGAVDVVAEGPGGGRVLAIRSAGDVVGEMALLTSAPRMAGLVAGGDVRALSIDRRSFEAILRERPETSLGVIRVLCQRLAEAGGRPDDTGSTKAPT